MAGAVSLSAAGDLLALIVLALQAPQLTGSDLAVSAPTSPVPAMRLPVHRPAPSIARSPPMIEPELMRTLATLYGVGAAATALLQARQVLRRGSSCEVSARFFATYAGGYAVWLLYGLSISSLPLILVDAAGLLCGLVTLAVTLSLRGSLLRPSSWRACPERSATTINSASGGPAPASG